MLILLLDCLIAVYTFFFLSLFITDYSFIFPRQAVSNIGGPTGAFLFLLFARWLADKLGFAGSPVVKNLKRIAAMDGLKFALICAAVLFLALLAVSGARHLSLGSTAFDLGIFDQAVWNAANGRGLFSTVRSLDLMGDHFEPVLFLIAPLYKLWPSVYVLLILQSALLASAVIPLYLIARHYLKDNALIFSFIVSYMLSRPLRGVAFSDFHPECFILVFLFWAYYFLLTRRNIRLAISLFFLLLCKEDVTFLVAGLGLFTAFFQKRIKLGIFLSLFGIALWFIETGYILPAFNPSGEYYFMRRLPFGLTYGDNLRAVFTQPALLPGLLFSKVKLAYVVKIFGPLGFLALLSPPHYILIAIPLFKNLLATQRFGGLYNITSHYTAGIIPFVYIASICGVSWLLKKIKRPAAGIFISSYIVVCSLFFYGKTDAHKFARFTRTIRSEQTLEKIAYLRSVPPQASVATNFNLVPQISERPYIYVWNPQEETSLQAQYLVIDLNYLDYLSREALHEVGAYLKDLKAYGYKNVYANPDKTFLIFYKPQCPQGIGDRL